jgi:undecaprenyl-diphosphatase
LEIIDALILGAVQGLTEFLPVSSSGHLELGKAILGDNALPSDSLLFTVVLHAATALSTVVVFRKDIWSIVQSLFRFKSSSETNLALNLALSTLPAAFVGLFFEAEISALFDGKILFVGAMLIEPKKQKNLLMLKMLFSLVAPRQLQFYRAFRDPEQPLLREYFSELTRAR